MVRKVLLFFSVLNFIVLRVMIQILDLGVMHYTVVCRLLKLGLQKVKTDFLECCKA